MRRSLLSHCLFAELRSPGFYGVTGGVLLEEGAVEVGGELVLLEVADGVVVEEELVLLGEGETAGD